MVRVMKRLIYVYSKIGEKVHTKFISNKTMLKEAQGTDKVYIYECNEYQLWQRENGFNSGKYVTTISLN